MFVPAALPRSYVLTDRLDLHALSMTSILHVCVMSRDRGAHCRHVFDVHSQISSRERSIEQCPNPLPFIRLLQCFAVYRGLCHGNCCVMNDAMHIRMRNMFDWHFKTPQTPDAHPDIVSIMESMDYKLEVSTATRRGKLKT